MRYHFRAFSLLELLVALALLATIAAIAYAALTSVQRSNERARGELTRLKELQVGMHVLADDLSMVVRRSVAEGYDTTRGAFVGYEASFEFSRAGALDPGRELSATLSRVAYRLKAGQLMRRSRFAMDSANESANDAAFTTEQVQISGIQTLGVRYMGKSGELSSHWDGVDAALPRAVELVLTVRDIGDLRRLILVDAR